MCRFPAGPVLAPAAVVAVVGGAVLLAAAEDAAEAMALVLIHKPATVGKGDDTDNRALLELNRLQHNHMLWTVAGATKK